RGDSRDCVGAHDARGRGFRLVHGLRSVPVDPDQRGLRCRPVQRCCRGIRIGEHGSCHYGGRKLGLPMIGIIALALLAVPRVVLHDLGVITEGTWVNAIFVFVPPLIWIAVMAWWRVS